jgi:hypothetical protein
MKIRLHGTEDECAAAAAAIAQVLDVVDVSAPYHDRAPSRLVRIYLDTRPTTRPATAPAGTPGRGARKDADDGC